MLDTEPVSQCAWKNAAREAGYDLEESFFEQMTGRNMASVHALLLGHCGGDFPAVEIGDRARQLYRDTLSVNGVIHKPGLAELLGFLDERQVPRAVATSATREEARHQLDLADLLHRFETIVTGDQVSRGKPDPELFLLAAERLGCRPGDCAVLEDSGPGIRAARAAGMTAILVPDSREPEAATRQAAHVVVSSLDAARAVLERLLVEPGHHG